MQYRDEDTSDDFELTICLRREINRALICFRVEIWSLYCWGVDIEQTSPPRAFLALQKHTSCGSPHVLYTQLEA